MGLLGFYDEEIPELKYSPFYVCTVDGGQRSMEFSCTALHLKGVFDAVQACLYRVGELGVEWVTGSLPLTHRMWSGRLCSNCCTS